MNLTITFGTWVVPAAITIAMLVGWRVFGARAEKQGGSMFPDFSGMLMEALGYVVAIALALAAWLVWALW